MPSLLGAAHLSAGIKYERFKRVDRSMDQWSIPKNAVLSMLEIELTLCAVRTIS